MSVTDQLAVLEEWRPVVGYEGRYEVSSFGNVRSVSRFCRVFGRAALVYCEGKVLTPRENFGYLIVTLGHCTSRRVHRLVATAFIPNPLNLPQVNHIDCDRANNRRGNLEWATQQANMDHAVSMGRMPSGAQHWTQRADASGLKYGEDHPQARLSAAEVLEIYTSKEGPSATARRYGVTHATVARIRTGKTWSALTGAGAAL